MQEWVRSCSLLCCLAKLCAECRGSPDEVSVRVRVAVGQVDHIRVMGQGKAEGEGVLGGTLPACPRALVVAHPTPYPEPPLTLPHSKCCWGQGVSESLAPRTGMESRQQQAGKQLLTTAQVLAQAATDRNIGVMACGLSQWSSRCCVPDRSCCLACQQHMSAC